MKLLHSQHILLVVMLGCITSCANLPYTAKPLDTEQALQKFQEKSIYSQAFKAYLLKQGYSEQAVPFSAWGLDELTYAALFYHPDLSLAKSKLALAQSNAEISGLRQNPSINAQLAHSNLANGDKEPWAYGLQVEIPIETTSKRAIKVEKAQHLEEVARMDVAEMAWNLRHQLELGIIDYAENAENIKLLEQHLAIHEKLITLYNKRLLQGLSSNIEVSKIRLQQQKVQYDLSNEQAKTSVIIAKLASDTGLTVEQFISIPIQPINVEATVATQNQLLSVESKKLQEEALLNRIDIRRSIAQYAAAEANIKLEVAKQTPDISLSPGVAFEFGDSIWSLGFTSLLNLLNQHPAYIKQAEQLRAVEGAQFESLQSTVINNLSQSYAKFTAIKQKLAQAKVELSSQHMLMDKLQKQFEAGLVDRVEITHASLNIASAEQIVSNVEFELLRAQAEIENLIQRPLDESASTFNIRKPTS
jgi:outer membrane protein, heavy metal efflux system